MKTMLDIATRFEKISYLVVGDVVKDESGDSGEILGRTADGLPVVLFDEKGEQIVPDESKLQKQGVFDRPGAPLKAVRRDHSRVPLEKAKLYGFRHIAFDVYQFIGNKEIKAGIKKYPWDPGSFWIVQEAKNGEKVLVKDEQETGLVGNEKNKPQHQLDSADGSSGPTVMPGEFNIFN